MSVNSYIMYNPKFDIIHCAKICIGNALEREFECLQNAMGNPWQTVILNEDYRDFSFDVLKQKCKEFIN